MHQGMIWTTGFHQGHCHTSPFMISLAGPGHAAPRAHIVCGDLMFCSWPHPHPYPCSRPRKSQPSVFSSPGRVFPALFLEVHCIKAVKCILEFYDFQISKGIFHNSNATFLEIRRCSKFLLFVVFLPAIWIQSARRN